MKNLILLFLLLPGAFCGLAAQTSTARLQGTVTDSTGSPAIGAAVMARNVQTGFSRGAAAGVNGYYTIPGLQPGAYEVTVSLLGYAAQKQTVQLGIGQVVEFSPVLRIETTQLEGVVVTAPPPIETRTQEVATNVTTEQINNLPLAERNFLNLATLAPGVRAEGGSITAGGLSANNINVFIDGASFKSDVLTGGVAGQDASRGNPFPQNAIQEFRVITQQFKAEYQKAASAVITARTKSGGNEFSGSAFTYFQNKALVAQDYLSKNNPDLAKPDYSRYQVGASLGGPIIRDKLNFFLSYEGNYQNRFNTVIPVLGPGTPPELGRYLGTFESPFRSNLFFGKLSFQPSQKHLFELSSNIRSEFEYRGFGGISALERAEDFNNNVSTYILRHQFTATDNLLNEAQVSFQRYRWRPVPLTESVGQIFAGTVEIGGRGSRQDFTQDRLALRNDLTYTAGAHVFKGGATLDLLNYNVIKELNYIPQFNYETGNFTRPINANFGYGDPDISARNTQIGVYIQDDWTVARRLTLNLGVRWDYETNMINNRYVTPAEVRQTILSSFDPAQGNASFFNPADFFSDGNNRRPFAGAIQPRVGFSYDLFGNGSTTLFGGWGIYYDRIVYNDVLDEQYRLQWLNYVVRFSEDGEPDENGNLTVAWNPSLLTPGAVAQLVTSGTAGEPEVFLVNNNTRPPKSYQGSLGVRQTLGDILLSVSYSNVRSHDNLTYFFGNRGNSPEVPGYSNVLVNQPYRTWYDAVFVKLEKPFTEQSRWGGQLAYTLAWSDTEANGTFGGLDYISPAGLTRFPNALDERHRIVGNWIFGLPFGIQFSGIATFGSGTPYNVFFGSDLNNDGLIGNDFPAGSTRNSGRPVKDPFIFQNVFAYRNVDLRLEKKFTLADRYQVSVLVDAFNIFNYVNFAGYEGNLASPNFGRPNGLAYTNSISPARSFQFGVQVGF